MFWRVHLQLVTLTVVLYSIVPETGASAKRGLCIAAKHHKCEDFAAWNEVNWWYTWTYNFQAFEKHTNCSSYSPGWVAMIWGWPKRRKNPVEIPAEATAVLGFNEPNHIKQADLTAKQAASHWPEIQKEADARGLTLVSPAAAKCGKHCHGDVVDWFDEFFRLCTDCRIDYLATHTYWCSADKYRLYNGLGWVMKNKK